MTDHPARRITWFGPPDRPVEGTVHVRPAPEAPMPDPTPEDADDPRLGGHHDPADDITPEWLAALEADLDACDDAEQAIVRAIGSATMCWEHVERAGCFRPQRALVIAETLHKHLAKRSARGPRVWLPGDTVPGGVWTVSAKAVPPIERTLAADADPRVEMLVARGHDFAAAVAAEQARRATTEDAR